LTILKGKNLLVDIYRTWNSMTQEEKKLLLVEICTRQPYGVKVNFDCEPYISTIDSITNIVRTEEKNGHYYYEQGVVVSEINSADPFIPIEDIKLYLRPLSTMTEEEYSELRKVDTYYGIAPLDEIADWTPSYSSIDWLLSHHFDYRYPNLIELGLAKAAPIGIYD